MFKKFNLQNEVCKDKYILMKNIFEEYCEIPKEYIETIHYSWQDVNTMQIVVPYLVSVDGVKKENPLYDKFLGKRQYIKVNDEEFYVVTACEREEDCNGQKIKSIEAQSAEITLNDFDFYIGEGGVTRKLFKVDNEIDISEGLLDLILAETDWKVGTVTEKARMEFNKVLETYNKNLYSELKKTNVQKEIVLWEQSFTDLNPLNNNAMSININYKNIKSYIDGKLQKDEMSIHQLGNFHSSVRKIKATYSGNDEYRYAVKYEITLGDGLTTERWCEFTYLDSMDITFETIDLVYNTGLEVVKGTTKFRSFDEGIYKIYDFLKEEVAIAYGVKFVFDTINRTISCYDYSEIGEETPLYLSYENFIKTINKKEQYDYIITKLYVESQNASISEENPTGLDYILDFTYFKENGLMSEELQSAYNRYLTSIDGKQDIIVTKRIDLNTLNKEKIKLDTERYTLEENIKGLQSIWNAYVKEKDEANATRIATEIKGLQDKHAQNLRETELCKQKIDSLGSEIKALVESITIETAKDSQGKIFNERLLTELNSLIITETLEDDYYTTSYSLYNYAVQVLAERNKLPIEFSVDTVGLLQNMIVPNGYTFDNMLTLGDYINIEDEEMDNGKVRLIEFDYSPKEFKISGLKFSNNDKDFTDINKIGNVGRTINKSATYTNNYKTSWVAGKDVNNFVNSMLTDYLDTKAVNIRSRQGRNKYDQSEVGMFIIDALSVGESSQIYIGSGMICFTDDNWLHCQTCLDGNGLVGETIVGKIIAGHNLLIGNENNTMVIDENGITIEGNHLYIKGTDGTNKNFTSYIEMLENSIKLGVESAIDHTNAQVEILSDKIAMKVSKGEEFQTEFSQTAEDFNFQIGKDGMNVNINKDALDIHGGALQVWNKGNTKKMIYLGSDGNAVFGGDIKLELASDPTKYIAIKAVPYSTDIGCKMVLGGSSLDNSFSIEDKNTVKYFWVNRNGTYVSNNLYIISDQKDSVPLATDVFFDDGIIYPMYNNCGKLGTSTNKWNEANIVTGRFYNAEVTNNLYTKAINTNNSNVNMGSGELVCGGGSVNGSFRVGSNLTVDGDISTDDISCYSVDATRIYGGLIYSEDKKCVIANGRGQDEEVRGLAVKSGGSTGQMLQIQTRNGDVYGIGINVSDVSLKENIKQIDNGVELYSVMEEEKIRALDTIKKISHYSYDFIDKEKYGNGSKCGYIAQQLKEADESFAFSLEQKSGDTVYAPNTSAIIPYVTKAIKEQQIEIEELRKENEELKNRLSKLEEMMTILVGE